MSVAALLEFVTTVVGVVHVAVAALGAAGTACCLRSFFSADEPLSGTKQVNAMPAKKRRVPRVTRAVLE